MKIKKSLKIIIYTLRNSFFYYFSKLIPKNEKVWVFGEWFGERAGDNATYLANYLVEMKSDADLKVFWISNNIECKKQLNNKIAVLNRRGRKAKFILLRAKYVVMGQNYYDFSESGTNYFGNAITVNLWHGASWKSLGTGYQITDNPIKKLLYSSMNKFNVADYFISVSEPYSTVIKNAFGVDEKKIINSGFPRNSIFYSKRTIEKNRHFIVDSIVNKTQLNRADLKVVTYMPTFRNDPTAFRSLTNLLSNDSFNEYLEDNNIVIVQKAHFVNILQHKNDEQLQKKYRRVIDLYDVSAQELLCATDLLITDYSGVFFDFLLLDRPIVYYLYDILEYTKSDRGLDYSVDVVTAGDCTYNEDELIFAIKRNLEKPDLFSERRRLIRDKYMTYENQESCKIIIDAIEKIERRG